MKRFILCMMTLICTTLAFAGNVDDVISEFKGKKHASYISVPSFMLKFASKKLLSSDIKSTLSGAKYLNLTECSNSVKKSFVKATANLDVDGFAPLVQQTEKNETKQILVKQEGEYITSVIAVYKEDSHCMLVQLNGKIVPSEVNEVIESTQE